MKLPNPHRLMHPGEILKKIGRTIFCRSVSPNFLRAILLSIPASLVLTLLYIRNTTFSPSVDHKEAAGILSLLKKCHEGWDGILTRDVQHQFGGSLDQDIVGESCFPIEITVTQAGRSMGHCSDYVQYVYFAGARLSPYIKREFWADRCPNSIHVWGEHPVQDFFDDKTIRNLWMPNVEQVPKYQTNLVPQTHAFLAKSKHSVRVISAYLDKTNLSVPVRYMSHSSADGLAGVEHIKRDFNKFFHGFGHSGLKSTRDVVRCWAQHSEWPTLTLLGTFSDEFLDEFPDKKPNPNVIFKKRLDIDELRRAQRENAVHICPSVREGFGHYINDARAVGAMIVTTDFGPMNEFVDGNSGVLVPYTGYNDETEIKLFPSAGIHVQVIIKPEDICAAVEKVLAMPLSERERRGNLARTRYEVDRQLMVKNLGELRRESLEWFLKRKLNGSEAEEAFIGIERKYRDLVKERALRSGAGEVVQSGKGP
ncbi:hypothetical protein BJ742DRAFT_792207 [Cladochytrium replicatum]|nr:hypothetical protein BJ742DRAFT_792207 [Cladochytrium replicatum]